MATTETSLEILLHDCQPCIYSICSRRGIRDWNDIDDIQQSVLFRVVLLHRKGYSASEWKAVIVAMTKHAIFDLAQKKKREQSRLVCIESLDQIAMHESPCIDEQIDARTIIDKLTRKLKPGEYTVFQLWMRNFSSLEASYELGISNMAYKARLSRLMKKMKKIVKRTIL